MQDKASCFTAEALMHGWTCPGDVIDACAAPGNKTRLVVVVSPRIVWWTKRLIMIASHLACLVGKGKTVFAFDKSETRAKVRCARSPFCTRLMDSPCAP